MISRCQLSLQTWAFVSGKTSEGLVMVKVYIVSKSETHALCAGHPTLVSPSPEYTLYETPAVRS